MKRNTCLDSLRGIAILGIMLIHIFQNTNTYNSMCVWIQSIIINGDLGVEISFVISAILYTKRCQSISDLNRSNYAKLVKNKIFTIIPLYYFSIIIDIIYHVCVGINISLRDIIIVLLGINYYLVPDYPGSGYIAVLLLMWLIYPLYCNKVKGIKYHSLFFGGGILLSNATNLLYQYTNIYRLVYVAYVLRGCMCFVAGNIIYNIIENYSEVISFSKKYIWLADIFILFQMYILMLMGKIPSYIFIVLVSIIILINYKSSIFIIDNKLFSCIGRHSLAMFLFHECLSLPLITQIEEGSYLYAITLLTITVISTFIWDNYITRIFAKNLGFNK